MVAFSLIKACPDVARSTAAFSVVVVKLAVVPPYSSLN